VRFSRDGDRDRVDHRADGGRIREGARIVSRGDLFGASRPGVDHADEIHVVHACQQTGVVLPEVADADDCDAKTRH
jgi:hypothetical protein